MITLKLEPIQHQMILESLLISADYFRNNGLDSTAELLETIKNEISLDTLEDKSKKVNE